MKKILIYISILVLFFSQTVFAEVSQLIFTTEPMTVLVGVPSEIITVQLQNSLGAQENAVETIDLVFTSTSPTGQFLSATTPGNPVVARINTGSANKNFLYQDSTSGAHTISIVATGRTSQKIFKATQQITITSNSSIGSTASTTESNTVVTEIVSGGSTTSAHSSSVPLSDSEGKKDFEISAGRDRLTTVGNNLVFQATATKLQNTTEQNIVYDWSFGDGTVGKGKTVNHKYRFAGEYSVVVNASVGNLEAVSRVKVSVISPEIWMQRISDGIEIWNKSKVEINLEGWTLSGGKKTFTFPKDTLIGSNVKVIFANETTGINENDVKLSNPIGKIVYEIQTPKTTSNLEEIETKIEDVRNKLAEITPDPSLLTDRTMVSAYRNYEPEYQDTLSQTIEKKEIITKDNSDQVANVNEAFEAPKKTGFISRVFSWPIKGFNFLRSLFVEQ
jgi:hypothetical protein